MKHITLITIGLLFLGAVTPALAQDDAARIAALEERLKAVETQNYYLKAAVEKVSGMPLTELLKDMAAAAPVTSPPAATVPTAPSAPDPAKVAAIAELKTRIAHAEKTMADEAKAEAKRKNDPFAKGGVSTSKADAEKRAGLQARAIAEMKAQLAAMEN